MLCHWIWYGCRTISDRSKRMLLEYFRDAEEIYAASEEALKNVPDMTEEILQTLLDKDITEARQLENLCRRMHISLLTFTDEKYPLRLRSLHDGPVLLYYQGMLPDWNSMPVIGIVGTRQATSYGVELASAMSGQIAACGGMVVSGGAKGIDTVALESALSAGGPVVAVLAGGLDRLYPAVNIPLFRKISMRGCLISEYPPGTPANAWHFPIRNRIISGLSNGLLVVEAPAKSGALISARHALEQGRDVFSVPGSITSPTSAGTNALLQEGARAVLSGWDVMKEYAHQYPGKISRRDMAPQAERPMEKVAQKPQTPKSVAKKSIDKLEKSTYSGAHTAGTALTEPEKALVACVAAEGSLMDEIIAQSGMNAAEAKKMLTKLALKKVLVLHPGGRVTLKQ